jgi:hypothetical protein
VVRERFRNDYVVIWKPDQIFKKSDREGGVSQETSPSRFWVHYLPDGDLLQNPILTTSQWVPHISLVFREMWETQTLIWVVEEFGKPSVLGTLQYQGTLQAAESF